MQILLYALTLISPIYSILYSARIQGTLMCRGKPEAFAELQLLTWRHFSENGIMAEGIYTDEYGRFDIYGYIDQYFRPAGRLWIWHECFEDVHAQKGQCKNWKEFKIPGEFVNRGKLPRVVWNMGSIHLDSEQGGDYLDKCKG
ncbi:hypothetical protein B9Z55_002753 [Caenorhabditis nigoni]|uniref:Transthyretin-like family protein n=2 Tax=Caenorhabditis nigoni TaxID=1611254 RepID=A0A2G5VM00_9PELO|nr:hypothetical protein B9Z55_002753 [Caenorhabditis nigoni]